MEGLNLPAIGMSEIADRQTEETEMLVKKAGFFRSKSNTYRHFSILLDCFGDPESLAGRSEYLGFMKVESSSPFLARCLHPALSHPCSGSASDL